MPDRSRKTKADTNELAKRIVDRATKSGRGLKDSEREDVEKDPAAVSLGRRGGLKGGKARASALSAEQRAEIARKAARARWSSDG